MNPKLFALLAGLLLLALLVSASVTAATTTPTSGVTIRVSVTSTGQQANPSSMTPVIAANGQIVAFESNTFNLVANDTNAVRDIFVHDLATGQTRRVSVASDGAQANGESSWPSLSADGRYVAFYSKASNLVPDDTNNKDDVFVHDRVTGQTTRVSVASDGTQGNDWSDAPALSADGQLVAFMAWATNLVPDDTNARPDVFVHDRATGQTRRVSVASDGTQGDGYAFMPALSADGRYVAFSADSTNLVAGDTNAMADIFVHDRVTGSTTRVSVASDGSQGNDHSYWPALSADGHYVAFDSAATNLVASDTNNARDVFVHDRTTGVTTRVSVASNGSQSNGASFTPQLSTDGRHVVFASDANNLVVGDIYAQRDVFVHDQTTGVTSRVSISANGIQGTNTSESPSISASGQRVAFASLAGNLVADDTNGEWDIFVRDRCPTWDCASFHHVRRQPDLDGNGKADLLWRHATEGLDGVWLMNETGVESYNLLPSVSNLDWHLSGMDDLDADGKTDLIWHNPVTGETIAWFMHGVSPTYSWLPTVTEPGWVLAGTGDLDRDGKADLVWRHPTTRRAIAWMMNGASVVRYVWHYGFGLSDSQLVGVGDLNADNQADFVWNEPSNGQTYALLMQGSETSDIIALPIVFDSDWRCVGMGDLNADEMADLFWRNTTTGQNVVWFIDSGAVAGYAFLPTVADQDWKLVAMSDLDGDAQADLVWRNFSSGQNIAWLMDGATVRSYTWLATVADPNWRVVSPTSLLGALNGLLPGPTKMDKGSAAGPMAQPAAKDAAPMWSDAPKDAPPMWRTPTKAEQPPMGTAPESVAPFWRPASPSAVPPGLSR